LYKLVRAYKISVQC